MLDRSIEKIMKEAFPSELPYGFAERVARNAMRTEQKASIWDLMLGLTPRAGLALGAVAVVLAVLGFAGDGPSMLDAASNYDAYSNFISLP